jgi:hypothetical protein
LKSRFADYELAAVVLFFGALSFISFGIVTSRGDLISATLILSGVACFVAGLYMITFSRGEPFDPRIAALLPVQGSIDICSLCADLGVGGNGHVIAPERGAPVHFIPVAEFQYPEISEGRIFLVDGKGGHGIMLAPSGLPLLTLLETDHALAVPREEPGLLTLLEEVGQDVLSLAGAVQVMRKGDSVLVELQQYRLMEGCRIMRNVSPKCCMMYPCPVCSLFACLLSRGTGKAVTLERTTLEGSTLRLIYSLVT